MKTIFNLLLILLVITVTVMNSTAQDIHFSQFYASPTTLNPATTGNFRGDYRVSSIYRTQWKAAVSVPSNENGFSASGKKRKDGQTVKSFKTANIAFDMPLYLGSHKFGVGLSFLNDETGRLEDVNGNTLKLTTTKITGSLSYLKKIKGHQIAFGIQPTLTYVSAAVPSDYKVADAKITEEAGAIWKMLDLESGEKIGTGKAIKMFDLNVGGTWSKDFGKFKPVLGLAMFHAINPKISVIKDVTRLPSRKVISFGGTYDLNKEFFIMPNVLFMANSKAHDLVYGFNVAYNLHNIMLNDKIEFNYIYIGPQIRHSAINIDALIITAGANIKQWNFGISRDITMSNLKTGAGGQLGTWEFTLIYIKPETLLQKKAIPCERY